MERRTFTIRLALIAALAASSAPAFAQQLPGEGVKLTACTSTSIDGWFREIIVKRGLEELGYEVSLPTTLSVPAYHQAVSTGDCSYAFDHWKGLHATYYEPIQDSTVLLGPGVRGVSQGILASKSVAEEHGISMLSQLADPKIAALFDSDGNGRANLCCTAPGWGAERVVNHLIDRLKLNDTVDHGQGEYSVLIADTVARQQSGEAVLFYTWTPNWLLGVLRPGEEVIWLGVDPADCEDPAACGTSETGFPVDDIYMITNAQLAEDNPAMVAFFNEVNIPMDALNAQNMLMHEGEDDEEDVVRHADDWIASNQELFASWVQAARDAAN